jgi:DNA polymerase III delta prime subunit
MNSDTRLVFDTLLKMPFLCVLLVGGVASGKTSLLNTLVLEYYWGCEPETYADNLMRINNLKDHGISYYKSAVKTFCKTRSNVMGKKKMIILDDLDLMNEPSQQVFRSLIDNYGKYVQFIASCTSNHKVTESIQSRFICVKLPPAKRNILLGVIHTIKNADNITMDETVPDFIVDISNNIIKNVISHMEKFKLINRHITLELARSSCTDLHFGSFEQYVETLKKGDLQLAIKYMYDMCNIGYSVIDILDNFFTYVKHANNLTETEKYDIIPLICKYITIFHTVHEDMIELSLFTNNVMGKLQINKQPDINLT